MHTCPGRKEMYISPASRREIPAASAGAAAAATDTTPKEYHMLNGSIAIVLSGAWFFFFLDSFPVHFRFNNNVFALSSKRWEVKSPHCL